MSASTELRHCGAKKRVAPTQGKEEPPGNNRAQKRGRQTFAESRTEQLTGNRRLRHLYSQRVDNIV